MDLLEPSTSGDCSSPSVSGCSASSASGDSVGTQRPDSSFKT
jgi:hypothetical protein